MLEGWIQTGQRDAVRCRTFDKETLVLATEDFTRRKGDSGNIRRAVRPRVRRPVSDDLPEGVATDKHPGTKRQSAYADLCQDEAPWNLEQRGGSRTSTWYIGGGDCHTGT